MFAVDYVEDKPLVALTGFAYYGGLLLPSKTPVKG